LAGFGQEFDLIFSNHTLEHLYTPEEVLATLAGLLVDHGVLISTLPMDAMPDSPFLSKLIDAATRKIIHPLDLVYLDAGHPWKTNPADLNATLQEVGFEQPHLYQRLEHLSRPLALGETSFKAAFFVGMTLHTFFFGLPRALAKRLFPQDPPAIISRCLLGTERRIWFGTNLLKNKFSQEVLVLARKRTIQ
jgi:SAM-dependent methyltransferase